jgi:hypothetical protein
MHPISSSVQFGNEHWYRSVMHNYSSYQATKANHFFSDQSTSYSDDQYANVYTSPLDQINKARISTGYIKAEVSFFPKHGHKPIHISISEILGSRNW